MGQMSATGDYTVVSHGFLATGERDQTEGRAGRVEVGRFTEVEEAIAAVRGQGVQGDSGYVSRFEVRLYEGGLIREHTTEVWGRRRTPNGYYGVGWIDMRDHPQATTRQGQQ